MMKFFRPWLLLVILALALPADAGMGITGANTPHTHTDANTGGSSLLPVTLTVSGNATFNGAINTFNGAITSFASSSTTFTGPSSFAATLSSTKACAAGYTRKGPNFCSRDATNSTNLARDVCTTDASLPSDAKAALVAVRAYAISTNAVGGPRSSKVFFFTSNTCATTLRIGVEAFGYEHTAVAASTLAGDAAEFIVPLDTNADFFIQQADDAGNTGAGQYSLNGYFD